VDGAAGVVRAVLDRQTVTSDLAGAQPPTRGALGDVELEGHTGAAAPRVVRVVRTYLPPGGFE
jgi:hypothetical protein